VTLAKEGDVTKDLRQRVKVLEGSLAQALAFKDLPKHMRGAWPPALCLVASQASAAVLLWTSHCRAAKAIYLGMCSPVDRLSASAMFVAW
jgi:hypothetical protein